MRHLKRLPIWGQRSTSPAVAGHARRAAAIERSSTAWVRAMRPRAGGAGDTMCPGRRSRDAGKTPDRSSEFPPQRSKTGLRARSGRIWPAEVDAAVVLAADVSRSIDDGEFALERRGYAETIQEAARRDLDRRPRRNSAGIRGMGRRKRTDDRRRLGGHPECRGRRAFAAALSAAPRSFVGRTAIGSAINFAFTLLSEAKFATDRQVIDVSGDGTSSQGTPVTAARDAAVEAGAIINGLTIFNRRAAAMGGYLALHTNPPGGLAQYYRDNVIGGQGAFVVPIDDFHSFADAMTRKLVNEIADGTAARPEARRSLASALLEARPLEEPGPIR